MTAPGAGLAPSSARIQATNSTNATLVKLGGGSIVNLVVANNSTATHAYMRLYDLNRVPLSTDTPFVTLLLPLNGYQTFYDPEQPRPFVNGLAYDITGAAADTDTTAVAANQVSGELDYY